MSSLLRGTLSDLTYRAIRLRNGAAHAQLRILMYHRVTDAHPSDRLCVPVARFDAQMRFLRERGYQAVSFAHAVRWVAGEEELTHPSVVITFDDGYEDNFLYAHPALRRQGFTGCFFVPSGFVEAVDRAPEDRSMTWAQLHELLRAGHEIGAHSVTHRKLTMLDAAAMQAEVRLCKEALERGLGRAVELFCYPAGAYNAAVRRAVAESGYRAACTVAPGANRTGADPFTLRRTEISAFDSLWDLEKKLAGAYDWLHAAVQWMGRFASQRQCANAMETG